MKTDKKEELSKVLEITDKQKRSEELHEFFKRIWDKCEDEDGCCYCYETGVELKMSYRKNTCCYHHLLPKSKYPELAFEEWNIVILHPDVHNQVEMNINKCPRVKALTLKLKTKNGFI